MNDTPDDTLPKRRRSAPRKAAKPPVVVNEPAVQAIIDHALHPQTQDEVLAEPPAPAKPAAKRRAPRKRARKAVVSAVELVKAVPEAAVEPEPAAEQVVESIAVPEDVAGTGPIEMMAMDVPVDHDTHDTHDTHDFVEPPHDGHTPPEADPPPAADTAPEPSHHHWVYLGLAVFLLALGFGLWGAWTTWFAGGAASTESTSALRARSEKLSQEVSTLRRSDQISREANRDLEHTLAERDEEIAGLRADIAFYERFVGATGQRRGLSVHNLQMRPQDGDVWHFVATLTQNLNRGAVNTGRVTLSIEGTRNDRLEKLSWSSLRKQTNAPGEGYSFKYFQQVEGEVMLPKDFKPLRVTVRLVPAGGSAVEQSFPWPEATHSGG